MKANELRIGNLIKEPIESGGKICQVKRIETDKDGYSHYLDHCSPIPLTEEWLLKFGFYLDEDGNFSINESVFTIVNLRRGIDLRERFEIFSHDFNPDLDYVHQLQNLYFALTGKELTSKE
jgi:hypothetical protein